AVWSSPSAAVLRSTSRSRKVRASWSNCPWGRSRRPSHGGWVGTSEPGLAYCSRCRCAAPLGSASGLERRFAIERVAKLRREGVTWDVARQRRRITEGTALLRAGIVGSALLGLVLAGGSACGDGGSNATGQSSGGSNSAGGAGGASGTGAGGVSTKGAVTGDAAGGATSGSGGTTSPNGGSASGGSATAGGSANGGSANGGSANGGSASGGSANGGSSGASPEGPCASAPLGFADANLEAAVRAAAAVPTGDLLASDVSNLTSLTAAAADIVQLDGIECLSALTFLS